MEHAAIIRSPRPSAANDQGGDDKLSLQKARDKLRGFFQRPSSGRTSTLGRKVEKPGSGAAAGPSGQTEGVEHDRKHANK
ncbi:hypothetical protein RAMLITH_13015 [Ramlibacter sp. RBP-2]|uniref:Uncharacterized protein n=1 Tax=Ramlibacter lithotrophicus TaxID=2606681 RepID=A0A7X6DGI5_9BURK|nr:hypothetical protein [Ramlibacter lithotrophicus]NKE66747.1 hypothetical protein [Ramlibacter lithotrophicus]